MKTLDMLELAKDYAKNYRHVAQKSIERNNHMNEIERGEIVDQRHIDAVVVDFINYIGIKHGIDYGLYTEELK